MKRVPSWLKYTGVAFVGLIVGAAIVGAGSKTNTTTTVSTPARTVRVSPDAQTLATLKDQVRQERDALRTTRSNISDERSTLQRLTAEVNGARTAAKKSQFSGTGTFAVGTDILPGTYRASAMPGCYWARLNSFDTSDILDNDNADGPVIVTILPSDKAFQARGCATFHKVG